MHSALLALLWVAALAIALFASHMLVGYLTDVGRRFHLSAGLLGLLVALGADAPEVTSALVALSRGSSDIGLGVVVGSNIYNLAGLLGLAALLARRVPTGPALLSIDRIANLVLTLLLVPLVLLPVLHVGLGVALVAALLIYVVLEAVEPERLFPGRESRRAVRVAEMERTVPMPPSRSPVALSMLVVASAAGIVIGSNLLVSSSLSLGPAIGIPSTVIGTFILPIATSLPNTWAAIVLARRNMAQVAIATTFNSNSINLALGAGLPSLVLIIHASHATQVLDTPWLLLMTGAALALVAWRQALTRPEGSLLIALYAGFVVLRLAVFP